MGSSALLVAIVSALVGAFLTKFVPTIWSGLVSSFTWLGRRVSSRVAANDFRGQYLDWVVMECSELKLTGIVPTDETKRPTLEQVFLSLRVDRRRIDGDAADADTPEQSLAGVDTFDDVRELLLMHGDVSAPAALSKMHSELADLERGTSSANQQEAVSGWLRANATSLDAEVIADYLLRRVLRQPRVAILGGPGAGKSTLLQYLALTFARSRAGHRKLRERGVLRERLGDQPWRLPIVFRLSTVATILASATGKRPSLAEVIVGLLPPELQAHPAAATFFVRELQRGGCIVLLDGLDEVPGDAEFRTVQDAVLGMMVAYHDNQFIITSRIAGWRGGIGHDFDIYYVNDLADRQISIFIDTWYDAVERNAVAGTLEREPEPARRRRVNRAQLRARELQQSLRENPGLRRLAVNPMLLSIIALVHRSLAQLPRERSKLYAECSKILLEQWDIAKGVRVDDTHLKLEQKEAVMRRVAIALHRGEISAGEGSREATFEAVVRIVAPLLPGMGRAAEDAAALLKQLIERSGIVVERQRGVIAFGHHTFQEYFAAEYLAASGDVADRDFLLDPQRLWSDWWREVILLYAGRIPDCSDFVSRIYLPREQDIFQPRLRLAAQCVHESVKSEALLRQAICEGALAVRLRGETAHFHQLKREVVAYLAAWSRGPEWYEHAAVAYCRRFPGDAAMIEEQLRQALHSHDTLLRDAAAGCLPHVDDAMVARLIGETPDILAATMAREPVLTARIRCSLARLAPEGDGIADLFASADSREVSSAIAATVTSIIDHYAHWTDEARWQAAKWLVQAVRRGDVSWDLMGRLLTEHDDALDHVVFRARVPSTDVGAAIVLATVVPSATARLDDEDLDALIGSFGDRVEAWRTFVATGAPAVETAISRIESSFVAANPSPEALLYLRLIKAAGRTPSGAVRARILSYAVSSSPLHAAAAVGALPLLFNTPHEAEAISVAESLSRSDVVAVRMAVLSITPALVELRPTSQAGEVLMESLNHRKHPFRAAAIVAVANASEPVRRFYYNEAGIRLHQPRRIKNYETQWNVAVANVFAFRLIADLAGDEELDAVFEEESRELVQSLTDAFRASVQLSFGRWISSDRSEADPLAVDSDTDIWSVAAAALIRATERVSTEKVLPVISEMLASYDSEIIRVAMRVLRPIAASDHRALLADSIRQTIDAARGPIVSGLLPEILAIGAPAIGELAPHLILKLTDERQQVRNSAWHALVQEAPDALGVVCMPRGVEESQPK